MVGIMRISKIFSRLPKPGLGKKPKAGAGVKPKPEKTVKSTSEKEVKIKIKALKKQQPGSGNYNRLGGNWISKPGGSYHITYSQKGKVISLFDLRLIDKRKAINPSEYEPLLIKSIKNSRKLGCEMIVLKNTWLGAKYPGLLKGLGFVEVKPDSEAKFSEFVKKKKISEEKLLRNPQSSRYPSYYLKL